MKWTSIQHINVSEIFAANDIDTHACDTMFTLCPTKVNGIVRDSCVMCLIDLRHYQHNTNKVVNAWASIYFGRDKHLCSYGKNVKK